MPRPRTLTPAQIADAALAVIDRDGLDALSMRAVARQLGVGAMSLYRYVADRDELEGLVVERVLGAADLRVPGDAPWRERAATLVEGVRDAIAAHPQATGLLLTRRHASGATLRWGEALMGVLTDGGFEGRRRAIAFRTLLSYLVGAVQVEHLGPLSGPGTAALAALPAGAFPLLAQTAGDARAIAPAEEFGRGLQIVLDGLAGGPEAARETEAVLRRRR